MVRRDRTRYALDTRALPADDAQGEARAAHRASGACCVTSQPISEAFYVLALYALEQGWASIGFRVFEIGPWTVTVNGTDTRRDEISPYHALIEHRDIVAIMVINPFGWTIGGWAGAEDQFIADVRAAMGDAS